MGITFVTDFQMITTTHLSKGKNSSFQIEYKGMNETTSHFLLLIKMRKGNYTCLLAANSIDLLHPNGLQ